jgi:short-subunit dehydrogenase
VIADFSNAKDIIKLIEIINKLGNIEFLVNNAGFGAPQDFLLE